MEKTEYKGQEYPIRYRHNREIGDDGYPKPHGGSTVAYIVLEWNENGSIAKMLSGTAECSKNDVFSKKLGRTIAKGRLLKAIRNGHQDTD